MGQDGPKMGQDGLKEDQEDPEMASIRLQKTANYLGETDIFAVGMHLDIKMAPR